MKWREIQNFVRKELFSRTHIAIDRPYSNAMFRISVLLFLLLFLFCHGLLSHHPIITEASAVYVEQNHKKVHYSGQQGKSSVTLCVWIGRPKW